jgi:hypothetical protein
VAAQYAVPLLDDQIINDIKTLVNIIIVRCTIFLFRFAGVVWPVVGMLCIISGVVIFKRPKFPALLRVRY